MKRRKWMALMLCAGIFMADFSGIPLKVSAEQVEQAETVLDDQGTQKDDGENTELIQETEDENNSEASPIETEPEERAAEDTTTEELPSTEVVTELKTTIVSNKTAREYVDRTVELTTNVEDAVGNVEYQYTEEYRGETAVVQEYAENPVYSFKTSGVGEHVYRVNVKDENAETAAETAEVPDGSSTPGEAVLTGASDFAAQAKLSREQVRSQSKADLQEILNNTEVGDEQKQEAVNTMVQMTEISEKEAAAEMLLEAKGFENAIVNLTGETADVVVPEAELEDAQRAQIEDIVKRKTGITPENIVITPLNEGNDEAATDTTSESDGEEKTDEQQTDTYKEQETSGEDIVTEGIYD